jgi:hypothetical protein
MRGWRRLGVVLSVLWFVGFGCWAWYSTVSSYGELLGRNLDHCLAMSSSSMDRLNWDDPQRDQKFKEINKEEEACMNRAKALFFSQRDSLKSDFWVLVLIVDVGSIALVWFLAWIIIRVSRWVTAGFRQSKASG